MLRLLALACLSSLAAALTPASAPRAPISRSPRTAAPVAQQWATDQGYPQQQGGYPDQQGYQQEGYQQQGQGYAAAPVWCAARLTEAKPETVHPTPVHGSSMPTLPSLFPLPSATGWYCVASAVAADDSSPASFTGLLGPAPISSGCSSQIRSARPPATRS